MDYKLGTDDPIMHPDIGAGPWNSEPWTAAAVAEKVLILDHMGEAALLIGRHAALHLTHYFDNTGTDFATDVASMVNDVPSAKTLLNLEIATARRFAETMSPGTWQITSRRASGGYNTKSESSDWFFAVGGYSAWGKGTVVVPPFVMLRRQFSMDFEYKFYDRYNWDAGKSVTIAGIEITDEFMGRFHRQGLAKEYNSVGSYRVRVEWLPGSTSTVTPVVTGGGR